MKLEYFLNIFIDIILFTFFMMLYEFYINDLLISTIFVLIAYSVFNYAKMSLFKKHGLNYFVIPITILLLIIPAYIFDKLFSQGGFISFDNLLFGIYTILFIAPSFIISLMCCLVLYFTSKKR